MQSDRGARVLVRDIMAAVDRLAPFALAEPWDHVGLQVGCLDDEVSGVLLALEADDAALDEAARLGCELVLAHHPLIFSPLERLTEEDPVARVVLRAARERIGVLVAHTNLDKARGGVADVVAGLLALEAVKPLVPCAEAADADGCEADQPVGVGLGRVGELSPPSSLSALAGELAAALGVPSLRYSGDPARPVRRVAVLPGSGASAIECASCVADVLVTGDVKYHEAREAAALGLALIDAPHSLTEEVAVLRWGGRLRRALAGGVRVEAYGPRAEVWRTDPPPRPVAPKRRPSSPP